MSEKASYSMRTFLDANLGRFRVFTYSHMKDNSYERDYQLVPHGLAWEVVTKDYDKLVWLETARDTLPKVE
jgi:hypothetical protein